MKRILLLLLGCAYALFSLGQDQRVSGKVTSKEGGQPVPGISITVKGSTRGTSTDVDGAFQLSATPGTVLIFEGIGFEKKEVTVGNQTMISVTLDRSFNSMSEVVVTGYGQQNRKTLTGAISSVKAAEIANIPVAGSDQLLQGRSAGVQVNSNSGAPGGGVFVRVRGTTSINASSDPLYIIDGIPLQSNNLSGLGLGGSVTSPMADINPADIESMEILKDASATAIYGARAANGVVLITTKRGSSGKGKIAVGVYYGSQKATRRPDIVNGQVYEELMNEKTLLAGGTAPYPNPENATSTNWSDLVFQTGNLRNVDLALSGGNEKVRYMVSANNLLQEGVLKNTDFKRSSARVNLDFSPMKGVKVGTNILYSYNTRKRLRSDDAIAGTMAAVFFYPTNIPVYNQDGSFYKIPTFEHPLAGIDETDISMITNRFLGSVYADIDILPSLKLRSTFSLDYSNVEENIYESSKTNNGSAVNGRAQAYNTNAPTWNQENVLTYSQAFGDHSLKVLVGTTVQESKLSVMTITGTQFPSDDFKKVSAAAIQTASTTGTSSGIASVFGQVTYDYDNKYLFTGSLRRDGSSRFGSGNQYGTFPSIGLGWVLSEEKFFPVISAVSFFKLRGSYGIVGNQSGINDFQSRGLWAGSPYGDRPAINPLQMANPDLKWETTKQLDIGFDISLFDNRVSVHADYYHKKTEDLLLAVSVPRTTGFSTFTQNLGEIENKGFEFAISADILRTTSGLTWKSSLNMSFNRNKIIKLAAPFNVYNRDIFRYQEGGEMFSFFLHPQTGVDPKTGDIIFEDVNGDGEFDVNNDRRIVGSANPDFTGGFTNNINFKGFDLMFLFQFSYGNEQLNFNNFFTEHGGTRATSYSGSQLGRWQQDGDITMVPRMTNANYASDLRPSRFLEDGSYMRLKNISLGYQLPGAWLTKAHISTARIYLSAQNLITFTKYTGLDPELTGTASNNLTQGIEFFTVPQPRTLMAGINVTF